MKKFNKKGFTLVEVLGVIVILGILALLVTNGIMGYFREGKEDYNKKLANQLTISGKTYFSDHREMLPTVVTDQKYAYVTVPEMQSNNYIKNRFIDSENRECSDSYVFVKQVSDLNEYEYTPCLICEGKNYSEGSVVCDPDNWNIEEVKQAAEDDDVDVCYKTDRGYKDVNGECVCESPKIEVHGNCVTKPYCGKLDKGYLNGPNGSCVCPSYKIEKNGKCVCPGNKIEKNGKCVCPPNTIEKNGECIEKPVLGEFSCIGTYDKATKKTSIEARSKYGINKLYYGNNVDLTSHLTQTEKDTGIINNKEFTNIPENAKVYMKDVKGTVSGACQIIPLECDKLDKGYENAAGGKCICPSPKKEITIGKVRYCAVPGTPICEFTKVPAKGRYIGTSGESFELKCSSDNPIKVGNTSKITHENTSAATLKDINYNTSNNDKTITFTGKIAPNKNKEEEDRLIVNSGLVVSKNDSSKTNTSIKSSIFYIDTLAPTITYSVTSGTETKSEAKNDNRRGYKDSVSVKVSCTDNYSGVGKFIVDGSSTSSPKTVTKNTRGNHTIPSECTDNVGNKSTGSKSYIVFTKSQNCDKCGCAAYNKCRDKAFGCQTHKADCSKCSCTQNATKTCYSTYYSCDSGDTLSGSTCYYSQATHRGPYRTQDICLNYCSDGRCGEPGAGVSGATVAKPWVCFYTTSGNYSAYSNSYSYTCDAGYCDTNYCIRCSKADCELWNEKAASPCSCKTCASCYY